MKKLIVVTGAGGGIGSAIVKKFSEKGHPVLMIGRDIEKMSSLNIPNSLIKKVDVTNINEIEVAVKEAEELYGDVDLMVNNAGVMLLGNIWNQDPKEWQTMLDVNVMGVLNGCKVVLPSMIDRKGGTIVNVSSIAGRKTFPNHTAYTATKFGVTALTENIREEVASKNVRMISIEPGAVETGLLSHTTDQDIIDGYQAWKETSMDGKGIDPSTIADSIYFAYSLPQNVNVRELVIADTRQVE